MSSIQQESSPNQQPLQQQNQQNQQPKRTIKACDYCKAKKIKCDGESPCSRCQKASNSCVYTHIERPKTGVRKRQTKKGAIKSLDNRIDKLEGLLNVLVTKIGVQSGGIIPQRKQSVTESQNEDQDDSENYHTSDTASPRPSQSSSQTSQDGITPEEHAINKTRQMLADEQTAKVSCGEYIGSQCTMSIFSTQGLTWICGKTKDAVCIKPIVKALSQMNTVMGTQRDMLSLPVTFEKDVVPLPPKNEAYELLEVYDTLLAFLPYVVEKEELKNLLNRYYSYAEDPHFKRELLPSEYLMLYMMVTIGSCSKGQEASLQGQDSKVANFQRNENRYFNSAFYYYQKVSIFGESITGLKAILMLTLYGSLTIVPELDYIIASTAIRLAQSLGLHRIEMLKSFPPDEVLRRRRLWFVCYILDRELCLQSGKPPIINDEDMSSIDIAYSADFSEIKKATAQSLHISIDQLDLDHNMNHCDAFYFKLKQLNTPDYPKIVENAWFRLAKITSCAYSKLFSATALVNKTRSQMMEIIENLNDELEEVKKSLPVTIRPGCPINLPKNSDTYQIDFTKVVKMQMFYNLVLMVINRTALSKHWGDYQSETNGAGHNSGVPNVLKDQLPIERKFSKICIQACTDIIDLSNTFIYKDFNLWLTQLFTFFSATITTFTFSMENPNQPQTRNIIEKMISNLLNDFNDCYPKNRIDLINYIKVIGMSFSMGVFVKIALKIYNDSNPSNPITEKTDHLTAKLFEIDAVLSRTIEEYKRQLAEHSGDRLSVTLSECSIAETLSKISSLSTSSVATTNSGVFSIPTPRSSVASSNTTYNSNANLNSISNPYSYSSFNPKMPEPKFPTHSNSNIDKNFHQSLLNPPNQSNQFQGYKSHLSPQYNLSPSYASTPTSTSNGSLIPPSIEDILSTDDLNINWNYFSHNLFNIPAPFMDEFEQPQSQSQNQPQSNQQQPQQPRQQSNGSSYLL